MKSLVETLNINESKFADDGEKKNFMQGVPVFKGFSFNVNISVKGEGLETSFNDLCVKRSIGQIVEAIIFQRLQHYYNDKQNIYKFTTILSNTGEEGVNFSCDFYLTNKNTNEKINIEIKAYKKESNVKLTGSQPNADYILGIKYNLSGNKVSIIDVVLFEPNGSKVRFNKEDTLLGFRLNNES